MATYYVRTTGNDTTGDGSTGTPWATPGKAVSAGLAAGDIVNIGPGTYTLSTSTPGAGGPVSITGESEDTTPITFQAEDPNDKPIIDAGAITSISVFAISLYGGALRCIDIIVDGQDNASVIGFALSNASGSALRCKAVDCPTGFSQGVVVSCEAVSCGTYGFSDTSLALGCIARSCAVGFFNSAWGTWIHSISYSNSSHGFHSTGSDLGRFQVSSCVAWNNGGDGFRIDSYNRSLCISNCISVANSGYGFNRTSASGNGNHWLLYCAAGIPNTSGNFTGYTTGVTNVSSVTLTVNPFVDATNGNFALNNTAGGGAACRAVGFPGTFPGGLSVGGLDIGAVQTVLPTPAAIAAAMWAYGHRQLT